jgi:hypothetical protein
MLWATWFVAVLVLVGYVATRFFSVDCGIEERSGYCGRLYGGAFPVVALWLILAPLVLGAVVAAALVWRGVRRPPLKAFLVVLPIALFAPLAELALWK